MTPALNWKAAERRVIAPFPTSDRSMASVKLRLDPGELPSPEEIRHIEGVEAWELMAPELFVDVNAATLVADTRLPMVEIAVSVIVRDRELNKFEQVATWPLDELPQDVWPLSEVMEKFSRCARLDIAVVATPCASALGNAPIALPDGALLAAKTFKIRVRNQGLDLPVVFVEPSIMESCGLDKDTFCYVHWKGEDMNRAPVDLIEIWLNKTLEDKFRSLSSKGASAATQHIARNISAYIYANVLDHVLSGNDVDIDNGNYDEPESLANIVGEIIEQKLNLTLEEARRQYHEGPAGQAKLMPWCWNLTGANKAFATMKF